MRNRIGGSFEGRGLEVPALISKATVPTKIMRLIEATSFVRRAAILCSEHAAMA